MGARRSCGQSCISTSKVAKRARHNHNHNHNTQHTTTKMSRHRDTGFALYLIFPWESYWRHQPMALRLPMIQRKSPVVGFGGAMTGSPVWGAE